MNLNATETSQREFAKAERREAIMEATRALLREPDAIVSSATIAKRAGVSVATVYNLIGKREVLLGSILNEAMIELGEKIAALEIMDPIERAKAVITVSIEQFTEDPLVYREVVHELSGMVGELVTSAVTFNPVELQIKAMTEAQKNGQVEAWVDPVSAGQQILTSYSGAMFNWSGNGDGEQFLTRALHGFWTAIAAFGSDKERERARLELSKLKTI